MVSATREVAIILEANRLQLIRINKALFGVLCILPYLSAFVIYVIFLS